MKVHTLILIFISFATGSLFSQNAPSLAPLNPDFLSFSAKLKNGEYPLPGSDSSGTGGIPPPSLVNFDFYLKHKSSISALFDPVYDMRSTGFLTPVRGQTANGCWAFATMASIESRWLVLGSGSWDLSENNLKYCHGFAESRSYYGNHWMSTAYFARRSGPLNETDDPNAGSLGPGHCPLGKIPVAYITDARYLPQDMNIIKQAVLDQGAIYTMLYYNSSYLNVTDNTYYYNGGTEVNHCIAIVGWDDTKETAGGAGAWICKNSYGIGWGEAGYFYVSYNDSQIIKYNAYWPVRFENVQNSEVYGYDDLGNYESAGFERPFAFALVKYISTGKQLLNKVATYAMAAGSTVEIDIFDNFNPVTKTLSGLLSHQANLYCELPGYYTFDLSSPIKIDPGNDFYIRIRYNTPDFNFPIPIEYYIAQYADPVIESNIAWISEDGTDGSWLLIGNTTTDFKWDPCVKIYAESLLEWSGAVSGDWNDAGNWLPENIPDASRHVIIGSASGNNPGSNSGIVAAARSLELMPNSRLTVPEEIPLTIEQKFTMRSDISGSASFICDDPISGMVEKYISGNAWHLISAPVSDAVTVMFTGKYLQEHAEPTNLYSDILSTSGSLTPLKGFALWGDLSGFTAQYNGLLNSGRESLELSRTSTGDNSGWNLVGNPYPSSIDWDASGWAKTNLNDAIYIEKNGGWATYVSGDGTNGGSQYISPGQGFFVNVAEVGLGSLTVNNAVRVHNETPFYKNIVTDSLVRLQVSGNGYTDEALVRFLPDVTAGFDGKYDALKLFGLNEESAQIYTMGNVPLAINSTVPGIRMVPLGIHANTAAKYTICATEINKLETVTLEDIKTGIYTDLLKNSYSFSFLPGENEKRFVLHFGPQPFNPSENSFADIYSYSQSLFVDLRDNIEGDIFVYTISGQLFASAHAAKGSIKINIGATGNYIVKVISDQATLVKKVFVQ